MLGWAACSCLLAQSLERESRCMFYDLNIQVIKHASHCDFLSVVSLLFIIITHSHISLKEYLFKYILNLKGSQPTSK